MSVQIAKQLALLLMAALFLTQALAQSTDAKPEVGASKAPLVTATGTLALTLVMKQTYQLKTPGIYHSKELSTALDLTLNGTSKSGEKLNYKLTDPGSSSEAISEIRLLSPTEIELKDITNRGLYRYTALQSRDQLLVKGSELESRIGKDLMESANSFLDALGFDRGDNRPSVAIQVSDMTCLKSGQEPAQSMCCQTTASVNLDFAAPKENSVPYSRVDESQYQNFLMGWDDDKRRPLFAAIKSLVQYNQFFNAAGIMGAHKPYGPKAEEFETEQIVLVAHVVPTPKDRAKVYEIEKISEKHTDQGTQLFIQYRFNPGAPHTSWSKTYLGIRIVKKDYSKVFFIENGKQVGEL
nr:hypothetical protein [uncultured Undibacterium sp.]